MRKFVLLTFCLMLTMVCAAQEKMKFSPEKFEADMAAYITKEAKLTEDEAKKYFPLLREMHQKQRSLYKKARNFGKEKPATEEACAAVIHERDKLEIEQRQIEQSYHKKMLQVIPASKLYDAIRAEARFHRKMMKGWQRPPMPKPMGKRP